MSEIIFVLEHFRQFSCFHYISSVCGLFCQQKLLTSGCASSQRWVAIKIKMQMISMPPAAVMLHCGITQSCVKRNHCRCFCGEVSGHNVKETISASLQLNSHSHKFTSYIKLLMDALQSHELYFLSLNFVKYNIKKLNMIRWILNAKMVASW